MLIIRNYKKIIDFINKQRSVFVFGPRGIGKTHFLTEALKQKENCKIINLLNKDLFQRYLKRPALFYQEITSKLKSDNRDLVVMVDEIQLLPVLLDEIHRMIEEFKPQITFVLTGSSARKLKRENANLLAGRALRVDFFPLGMDEIDFSHNFSKLLCWGTLPEVFTSNDDDISKVYLQTYVSTYLDEEIKKEAQLRNLAGFSRFLELAAAENGQTISYAKLARAAGIADVTVKEYFQVLTDTLLAYQVPAWRYSKREQLQQSPKHYLFDNGVINALLGELLATPNPSTYRYGRLFENLVLGQLMQYRSKHAEDIKLYHYRSLAGKEIDFIAQKNPHAPPIAIEVKSSEAPTVGDVKQLINFQKTYPAGSTIVICRTPNNYREEGIEFLSLQSGIERVFELAQKQ